MGQRILTGVVLAAIIFAFYCMLQIIYLGLVFFAGYIGSNRMVKVCKYF